MSCLVPDCRNAKRLMPVESTVTFHRAPRDPIKFKLFVKAAGSKKTLWTRNIFICSEHFKKSDFIILQGRKKFLKENVIPTENLGKPVMERKKCVTPISSPINNVPESTSSEEISLSCQEVTINYNEINNLNKEQLNKTCRSCLKTDSDQMFNLFKVVYENVALHEIYTNLTSIQAKEDECLSQCICGNCLFLFLQFYSFSVKAQQSYQVLLTNKTEETFQPQPNITIQNSVCDEDINSAENPNLHYKEVPDDDFNLINSKIEYESENENDMAEDFTAVKSTKNQSNVKKKTHSNDIFVCSYCKTTFNSTYDYKSHLREEILKMKDVNEHEFSQIVKKLTGKNIVFDND